MKHRIEPSHPVGHAHWVIAAVMLAGVLLAAGHGAAAGPVLGDALPGPLPLFPPDNWWNVDVSAAPVDPGSAAFIGFINNGGTRRLHPDLGGEVYPGSAQIYGMPYVVVDGTQPKLTVHFVDYPDESDGVNVAFYPIPSQAISQPHWVEGGDPGAVDLRASQDRHLIIVDRDNKLLYELYNVYYNSAAQQWEAGSGAFWDMKTNDRRPEGWTSADAAGLAILPGLIRYDEVYDPAVTEIRHAFRVTVRQTNGYVYPASHHAGSTAGALPMGARLRLRASKDISGFTPEVQKIFRAMKTYGLIVADNGSDMYISGTFDPRWNNDVLNPAFAALTASDFEVVQLGWKPGLQVAPVSLASFGISPRSVQGGQPATGTVTLSAAAPSNGVQVTLSSANPAAVRVAGSVAVGAGAASASFPITTSVVTATTAVGLTATLNGTARTAALTVTPAPVPTLSALSLSPSTVTRGARSTATVRLSGAAPAAGVVVSLASSKPQSATVPARITIAAGQSSGSFTIQTTASAATGPVSISASSSATVKTATLSIVRR